MLPHAVTQERAVSPAVADAAKNVSNLARRVHGWSWQAVRVDTPFCWRILTLTICLVSHWDGHWVSPVRSSQFTSIDPHINLYLQCRICLPIGNQKQIECCSSSRALFLLPQHRPFPLKLPHPSYSTLPLPTTILEARQGSCKGYLRSPHRSQFRNDFDWHYKLRSV